MDYLIITTYYNSDNVDSTFTQANERAEHWVNLTQKTYQILKKDTVPVIQEGIFGEKTIADVLTSTEDLVWDDNKEKIERFIEQEINRLNQKILHEKARMYEISHFKNYMKVGTEETVESISARIQADQDSITYLKNYVL